MPESAILTGTSRTATQAQSAAPPWIVPCNATVPLAALGGKAKALLQLAKTGAPIPPWFVVTPEAFYASLDAGQRQALQRAQTSEEVQSALARLQTHPQFREELRGALEELCPHGERVAVRSSAFEEDGESRSFAGQLESFLFVPIEDVARRVTDVWRSGFSERVRAYCRANSQDRMPEAPAVLIQRMVNAEAAGVAFSADPVTGRRGVAVVSAVLGLGTSLVSGESNADTYHVSRDDRILRRAIAQKAIGHRFATAACSSVESVAVDCELGARPAVTDEQVREIAEWARRAEAFFGRPQDIEWAVEGGRICLLQSRPITSLAGMPDPDGALALWDNSNIVESYGGVTTPLTFTFARQAYEAVYRQFCRIMRVAPQRIADGDSIFPAMLGLIRGRVYYNLLNWYRLLAMLPGYTWNRRFMEQMMGVRETLPEGAEPPLARARWPERLLDALRLLGMTGGMVWHHMTLPRRIRKFHARVEEALGSGCPDLTRLRADELLDCYRHLERKLLRHWEAPLVNDFLAMIFYGVLRKLGAAWCGNAAGPVTNELLSGEGGMISAEPAARVQAMARLAAKKPTLVDVLCQGSPEVALVEMRAVPELLAAYHVYLDKFGDRCLDELKLESPTLHDDPTPLLRAIGQLAARRNSSAASQDERDEITTREQAEERVRRALSHRPVHHGVFFWVLRNARSRVRDRENLRFERTRVFGRVRRIFVELGHRFHAVGRLDDPQDIFFLELEEIFGFIEGTASCTNLKGLAALRKAEREEFLRAELPAQRFETRGSVYQGNSFCGNSAPPAPGGDQRQGIGCYPGRVCGRVRVVRNPREARPQQGEVLAAERTDPGWVLLFPLAAGVLVERGSLLSHSAIVAREMGIPTVVSIDGLTRWLQDGDWVEFDGSTGTVVRIAPPEPPSET